MTTITPPKPSRLPIPMKISSIKDLTPTVREVIVYAEHFEFLAGQFAMLNVPTEPKVTLRAYSIASDDRNRTGFKLLFKYVPGGIASEYIWSLKGSETLNFTGPFGRVFFKEPPTEQIVFLSTGTGLSQHVCYLESKSSLYPETKFKMLIGVRNEAEIYYQPELEILKKNILNFEYEFVLSRPSESWSGKKGYVQNFLESFDYKKTPTTFYLCGNGGMIKEAKSILIEQNGLNPQFVLAEAFD